ncbi:MAG TPA: M42 family peptidase [Lachnospiraceae bacterium]
MKKEFMESLLSCSSVSGYEEDVQAAVEEEMKDYADEIVKDEMNNLICTLNPENKKRIMLCAHADEVGLMISRILENGRLQVIARGGIIPASYPGHQVCIKTSSGFVYGVVEGCRNFFDKEKIQARDLLVDIGAKSKEDALHYVNLGDSVVFDSHIRTMANGTFSGRALDDRIGVFIIMEALKLAKERGCTSGVYAASTVGEETTKSGAYWSSNRICPDLAIIVDVTYASDYSGMDAAQTGEIELGGGPVLCNAPIISKELNRKMQECAIRKGISIQMEVAERLTHTDGDQIHFSNQGVPIVLVSIPLRYMHLPCEVAQEKDISDCIDLIAEFLVEYK